MSLAKRVHLSILSNTRSVCRYSSRPSRRVKVYKIKDFLTFPVSARCKECDQYQLERHQFGGVAQKGVADTSVTFLGKAPSPVDGPRSCAASFGWPVAEQRLDKPRVGGANPSSPTILTAQQRD